VYTTSNFFVENLAIAHFGRLQALDLAEKDTASLVVVFFPDLKDLDGKRDALVAALTKNGFDAKKPANSSDAIAAVTAASPRYKVEKVSDPLVIRITVATLGEVLGIIGSIVSVINAVGMFLAGVLLLVTAVAIFINLRMSINDRMREIGTMRAIGIDGKGVTLLFVCEGLILSVLFVLLGFVVAFVLIAVLRYGAVFKPQGAFSLLLEGGRLVLLPRASDLLFVLAAIAVFAGIFSFIPARQAGRVRPVEALTRLE
jgi:putative ABC transport system permease protein